MSLEGKRRWLEVGEVSRVVMLERRFMKSGLPSGLRLWKVREGDSRSERSQGQWILKAGP